MYTFDTPPATLHRAMPAPLRRRPARGISLIELLMFIVIISVALVAILRVQMQSSNMSADPQMRKQALAIAEGLLEEISLARFTFCDPTDPAADSAASPASCSIPEVVNQEAGAGGRPFDNVNDYVSNFGVAQAYTTDAAGAAFPVGYSATVTITPDAGLGPAGDPITPVDGTSANMDVLRISVAVSYRNGDQVVLDGYRTRYAPNSVP